MLFGPVGAMIGGRSKEKTSKIIHSYLIFTFLDNDEINNYSHKNPLRSANSIRFKATRQWVRVDSIQHVSCFFARLYKAEK